MAREFFTTRPARRGLWFPLALGLLVVAGLPAAVLLLASLLGRETATNAWLQQHLALTYHFAGPAWLGLVLLLLPLLLILLYFLKLRRRPLEVPSTFLWRKSIEDLRVNSLFQWLRDNVLLLVQLLAVLVLLYGLLGLEVHGRTAAGRHYILLIDNSASMAATDVAPSRLEAARRAALREIDAHADGDSGMVIAFNSRAALLQPYTADKGLLRRAVESVAQTQRLTRLEEALALAESLANPRRSGDDQAVRPAGEEPGQARTYVTPEGVAAEAHLFSDGRFPDVPSFAAGKLDLQYHRLGASGPDAANNVGIVTLAAARDEQDPARVGVFARVLNFRPAPASVRLELEWRQPDRPGFQLRERELALPASGESPGEAVATFELGEVDDTANVLVHARLAGHRDCFATDDEAWLVVGSLRRARVLVVTPGNGLLRDFFDQPATEKVARVEYLAPADLADAARYRRPALQGAFDLVVFDRCAPDGEEAMPLANTFFIDSVPPPWKRADMPALKGAAIRNPASSHPLMRHLTALDQVAFADAFRFDLKDPRVPPRTPRLLETGGETAVLFLLQRRPPLEDLVLTFPLVNARGEWSTTWPLKLSFPVFLRNVVYELGHVRDAAASESIRPGEVETIRPDAAVETVEVTDPAGRRERLARGARAEFLYNSTEQVGPYRAQWPGGGRGFVVNLLDAGESDVRPRDEVRLGSRELPSAPPRRQAYELWKWGALAALALLALEWAVYNRRLFF
jgi:hypothetical protein